MIRNLQTVIQLKDFDRYEDLIKFAKKYIPEQYLSYVNEPQDIIKILRKIENEQNEH
jgi:hypothetical protein